MENKIHVPNHQPEIVFNGFKWLFEVMCMVITVHMINIPYMGHLLTYS